MPRLRSQMPRSTFRTPRMGFRTPGLQISNPTFLVLNSKIAVQNPMHRALNCASDVRHPTCRVQHSGEATIVVTVETVETASGLDPVTGVFHNANREALIEYLAAWAMVEDGMQLCVAGGIGGDAVGARGLPRTAVGAVVDHGVAR